MPAKMIRRVIRMSKLAQSRPRLPRVLFWDFDYDAINWRDMYISAIGRVLERGNDEEWQEMIRFYGYDRVIYALRHKIGYLPNFRLPKICEYFNLTKEELRCSYPPWWRGTGQWNGEDM